MDRTILCGVLIHTGFRRSGGMLEVVEHEQEPKSQFASPKKVANTKKSSSGLTESVNRS